MVDCCVKNGALKYFIVLFDKLLLILLPFKCISHSNIFHSIFST